LNDLKVGNIILWLDDVANFLPEFFSRQLCAVLIVPQTLKNMLDFRGFFTQDEWCLHS